MIFSAAYWRGIRCEWSIHRVGLATLLWLATLLILAVLMCRHWNLLHQQWALFPYGLPVLLRMLQVAPYPLLLLLSISTHSLIQLLGGLTSAEISEELVLRLLKQLTEAQMLLPGDDPAQEQISLAKWFLHDSGAVAKASSGHRIRLSMAEVAVAEALDQDHHKLMWDKKRAAKEDFWCKPCLTPRDFERTINGDSRITFRMVRARLIAVVPIASCLPDPCNVAVCRRTQSRVDCCCGQF